MADEAISVAEQEVPEFESDCGHKDTIGVLAFAAIALGLIVAGFIGYHVGLGDTKIEYRTEYQPYTVYQPQVIEKCPTSTGASWYDANGQALAWFASGVSLRDINLDQAKRTISGAARLKH